ncbi:MAG: hypothetical protein ABL867_09495 [Rickettsiales bacterium]
MEKTIEQQAAEIKAGINRRADETSARLEQKHKRTMAGIAFDSSATQQGLHTALAKNGLGDGKTGVDRFLETGGSNDHYEAQGKSILAARVDDSKPIEAGEWQYQVLNESGENSRTRGR